MPCDAILHDPIAVVAVASFSSRKPPPRSRRSRRIRYASTPRRRSSRSLARAGATDSDAARPEGRREYVRARLWLAGSAGARQRSSARAPETRGRPGGEKRTRHVTTYGPSADLGSFPECPGPADFWVRAIRRERRRSARFRCRRSLSVALRMGGGQVPGGAPPTGNRPHPLQGIKLAMATRADCSRTEPATNAARLHCQRREGVARHLVHVWSAYTHRFVSSRLFNQESPSINQSARKQESYWKETLFRNRWLVGWVSLQWALQ